MSDKLTTLISLIGKGRTSKNVKGYEKARYYFEERGEVIATSFFGSALYERLNKEGYKIDSWLIFGTEKSNWSELLFLVDEKYHNNIIELYYAVYGQEEKGISEKLLSKWEEILQNHVTGIRLILVDPLDYEIYINRMIHEIPDTERQVVLDITHALRHMSVSIAFSLMTLKHLKAITDVIVYYGAFELEKYDEYGRKVVPALKIDFINQLVSYAENLAVFNHSGYFPNILHDLSVKDTNETYFRLEMNRQPRKSLKEINIQLKEKIRENNHQGKIAEYIRNEMEPLIGMSLDKRIVERAKFFFDRKQYLQSLVLLHEGLILTISRKYNIEYGQTLDGYKVIRKYIKDNKQKIFKDQNQIDSYFDLVHTRNSAVHGSVGRGTQNYLEQQEHFEELFKNGINIYEYITR